MRALRKMVMAITAVVLAAGGIVVAGSTALAATDVGQSTFNRPSTVELGGAVYMAWAGTDSQGLVNVAKLNSDGTVNSGPWTYGDDQLDQVATAVGTGPTISATGNYLVVAWVQYGTGEVYVDAFNPSDTGSNWGYECETGIGVSDATAYITSEGDDGTGNLYVTYVDTSNHMHVDQLNAAGCNGTSGTFSVASDTTITSDTSFDGPALIPVGYNGHADSATLYLVWAAFASHDITIGQYQPGQQSFAAKTTETTHSTKTDMGGAYDSYSKYTWISYCGTNNVVYYQKFTGISGGTEQSGGSCNINTASVNNITYYSGGVGVGYDYSSHSVWDSWPALNSAEINTAQIG